MFVEAEIMYYLRSSNYYWGKRDKNSQKDDFYLPKVRSLKSKIGIIMSKEILFVGLRCKNFRE